MSYLVHVTAVVEGDLDQIEILMNDYRFQMSGKPDWNGTVFCLPECGAEKCFSLHAGIYRSGSTQSASRKGSILSGSLNRCPKKNSNFKDNGLQALKLTPLQDMYSTDKYGREIENKRNCNFV